MYGLYMNAFLIHKDSLDNQSASRLVSGHSLQQKVRVGIVLWTKAQERWVTGSEGEEDCLFGSFAIREYALKLQDSAQTRSL